jgi:SAM-dependent methyltransferase
MTANLTRDRAEEWQDSWDRQQDGYLESREERFTAMLDVVEAVTDGNPTTILDLAGGTGSISRRALRRFPNARTVLVDVDPVVLAIATASLDERTTIVAADLRDPHWTEALPMQSFDAVLTATALHWIDGARLAQLYAEIRDLLPPGGVLVNADHMADDGLPVLTAKLEQRRAQRYEARWKAGSAVSWDAWWDSVESDPTLGHLMPARRLVFDGRHAAEFMPPVSWHLYALRTVGFTEVGITWRGACDAGVTAIR